MILDDGTCWDGLPFCAALQERKRYGHGYRNESLEAKRRQAIEWLRQKSKTGWACDMPFKIAKEMLNQMIDNATVEKGVLLVTGREPIEIKMSEQGIEADRYRP